MDTSTNNNILIETGTNELEVLELGVGKDQCFGINVAKVREIIPVSPITKVPQTHPHVEGIVQIRNEVLPVIHLGRALGIPNALKEDEGFFAITEFNQTKMIFHVGWVSQIHRFSWEDIEKPSHMIEQNSSSVVGVINLKEKMILLVDFEKILADISPDVGINEKRKEKIQNRTERNHKGILIAEDSPLLRQLLSETLHQAGYNKLTIFDNGKELWDFLLQSYHQQDEQLFQTTHLVITDIEMPQMDGLHLTKKIKQHPILNRLPVVIFSSLVSDSLQHKGASVGADAQVGKPEVELLVNTLDQLIF